MRFVGQVVWITGASAGIGEALALGFHREGAHVILSGRREAELQRVKSLCAEGQGKVLILPFDVIDDAARVAAVNQVLGAFGHIDMLVNNAGVSQRAYGKDTLLAVDRQIMELDYFSVIALTKLVLPSMLARKSGHLVATSSVSGKYGVRMRTAYCASKHALHGFFDALRIELHPHIQVSMLVYGGVQTRVSYNALTGDGGVWGKLDNIVSTGTPVDECARLTIDGLAAKRHEIVVAEGDSLLYLYLKRFFPANLFKRQTKPRKKRPA
ncbi:MAG: SDR family NAD(P)-dependent oxidoreductase [Rhodospirillaceae bacterium]|nr:SDR family NAD(P)-dependent oxidoreductase [Rhodospirillaceae bacterium]